MSEAPDRLSMTDTTGPDALTLIEEMIERGGDIPEDLPGSPYEQEKLKNILGKIHEMHSFVSRMSDGDLNTPLSFRGFLAGPLKALQSSLRHLTWQAKMIAEGDLSQRVDFLGDFSLSFNQMVANLADNRDQLVSRKEELERSYAALSQANNKLNILSSITRHDILNHVMVIVNYCFLLKEAIADPKQKKQLEAIEFSGKEIQHLIEFTRSYQDMGVLEPMWQRIPVIFTNPTISGLVKDISLQLPGQCYEIFADQMLVKVMYNLVENSIRHGGSVTEIRVSYAEEESLLRIIYEDNGSGISEDEKEKVFKRGYGKNTGLGLFLIREILSITDITIKETGTPGEGVRFEMTVPERYFRRCVS